MNGEDRQIFLLTNPVTEKADYLSFEALVRIPLPHTDINCLWSELLNPFSGPDAQVYGR